MGRMSKPRSLFGVEIISWVFILQLLSIDSFLHKVSLKTVQRKDLKGFENGQLFLMGGIVPTKESDQDPEGLTTEVSH